MPAMYLSSLTTTALRTGATILALVAGWSGTHAQQPAAAPARLPQRTDADLEKLLLQVRELDLANDCKEQMATLQGELRARRTFGSAGIGQQAPAGEAPPEFLARTHREALESLRLPVRADADCQLQAEDALSLDRWASQIRRLQLVSTPERNGQRIAPKGVNLSASAVESQAKRQLTDAAPALAQMLQAEGASSRLQLIDLLRTIDRPAAVAALARLTAFDLTPEVRAQAVAALKSRPAEDYRPILLEALRHPWPPAAEYAAEALVALNDTAALPQLRALLDAPDPAAPFMPTAAEARVPITALVFSGHNGRRPKPPSEAESKPQVREVVRLNHLRNCLLCHPASTSTNDRVRGLVPTPGQPLSPAYYAERSGRDSSFVRADITYLRQDFSVMLSVKNPDKWPERQRFDFVARTRDATPEEVAAARQTPAGKSYPQREAVLFALQELSK